VPAVAGCPINDNPLAPICGACRRRLAAEGDAMPIAWIAPDHRYGEKLATPDVSMADLVGEIDPVKVAEGRYLADEETIHYGLVPRTNRGLFAINELPDLTEKVQVGLFNLMEERDIQVKGYKIRLPLDIVIVASANPEDYTSRGRIITPLKDRFDVQIRTHYPRTVQQEIAIMEQEVAAGDRGALPVRVPEFVKEILAQLTFEARGSNEINQSSGVSVRVTINNYESLLSNAEKRAVRNGEREVVPRLTDLHSILASTVGKIELEYAGEDKKETDLVDRLINRAIMKVWDQYLKVEGLARVIDHFEAGWGVEVSDQMRSEDYLEGIRQIPGLREAVAQLGTFESPALMACATEFALEGLHLHQKLNKDRDGGRYTYRA
jgi:magnesium chelatase subunit I